MTTSTTSRSMRESCNRPPISRREMASSYRSGSGVDPGGSRPGVIQYRNRGLHATLLPPLLILVGAVGSPRISVRPGSAPAPRRATSTKAAEPATSAGPARGRVIIVEAARIGAAVEPIMVRAATPPPPSTPLPIPTANHARRGAAAP